MNFQMILISFYSCLILLGWLRFLDLGWDLLGCSLDSLAKVNRNGLVLLILVNRSHCPAHHQPESTKTDHAS